VDQILMGERLRVGIQQRMALPIAPTIVSHA
jgi:hypothetical protein